MFSNQTFSWPTQNACVCGLANKSSGALFLGHQIYCVNPHVKHFGAHFLSIYQAFYY